MAEIVTEIADLLYVHANRDKVMSLSCYALKAWGAAAAADRPGAAAAAAAASGRLAAVRATTRLFDDAAALKAFMAYGLGRQEGIFWGTLGVAWHGCVLAYLQTEKVVWLVDAGVLRVTEEAAYKWRTAHKIFWTLFSAIGFVRSIRLVHQSSREMVRPDRRRCARARLTSSCLVTMKALLETVHAGAWLPPGWLWGGRPSPPRAAALAAAAAALALALHYHDKRLATTK